MDAKEMEARIKILENQVRTLQDIEAIKTLQKVYGFYLEHWMYQEIIDLFAENPKTVLKLMAGTFLGKDGVARFFSSQKASNENPEFLHQLMQLSGVVDIHPDGNTASGRWYGFGAIAMPGSNGIRQFFMSGIYECRYIKEDGKWKILELVWFPIYSATPATGWVKPERLATATATMSTSNLKPDRTPGTFTSIYPSGYIAPISFKHPVTGKDSSDKKHNATLSLKDPR